MGDQVQWKGLFSKAFGHERNEFRSSLQFSSEGKITLPAYGTGGSDYSLTVSDSMTIGVDNYALTIEDNGAEEYTARAPLVYRQQITDSPEVTLVQDIQRVFGIPFTSYRFKLEDGTMVNLFDLKPAEAAEV